MIFSHRILPQRAFRFSREADHTSLDRYRGLQQFGPFKQLDDAQPRLGFVFPPEYRADANKLFMAMKNGIGYFRGLPGLFGVKLTKEQVFHVPVVLGGAQDEESTARAYVDAIQNWKNSGRRDVDIFVVIHPRCDRTANETPYYRCKAALLSEGILSQHVTIDLIRNPTQFAWSAGDVCLQLFVKLGGIPWILDHAERGSEIIIGVGKAEVLDPTSLERKRTIAFTTCVRGNGPYEFSTVAASASSWDEYSKALERSVREAVELSNRDPTISGITLHLPKDFGHREERAIMSAVDSAPGGPKRVISIAKIIAHPDWFAIDSDSPDGIVPKGTCIRLSDRDHLIYTEGTDEKRAWRNRLPGSIHVRSYRTDRLKAADLAAQAFELSQLNYKGFASRGQPVSIAYSAMVAELLAHFPNSALDSLDGASKMLKGRMWFV